MRVLILGGTRFMGPRVVRRLVVEGHSVTIFHRGETEGDAVLESVEHIHGERARLGEFRDAFKRVAPEVVLDMFALHERDSRDLVATLRGIAGRLVVISSMDVYRAYGRFIGSEQGVPDAVPLSEQSPLRERLFPYRGEQPLPLNDPRKWADDYDKILVENAARGHADLPATILRLPMVYGPGDYQHRLRPYLARMDAGRPAILLGERFAGWRSTWGYLENVAAAIALAVTDARAAGRTFNVADAGTPTMREWVEGVGQAAGWNGAVVTVPDDALPDYLRQTVNPEHDLVASSARIRGELGYVQPIDQSEAFRRTVDWERTRMVPLGSPELPFDASAEDAAIAAAKR